MHAYAGTNLRMQLQFQRVMKCKFSALKIRFEMNLSSFGSRSKSPFFNCIKPYMVYFKGDRENPTRNSESKREFFTKHAQVNIFCLGSFLALIFEF